MSEDRSFSFIALVAALIAVPYVIAHLVATGIGGERPALSGPVAAAERTDASALPVDVGADLLGRRIVNANRNGALARVSDAPVRAASVFAEAHYDYVDWDGAVFRDRAGGRVFALASHEAGLRR